MIDPPKKTEQAERPPDTTELPPNFDPAYVEGAVKPFFLSAKYEGEPPLLPMIDLGIIIVPFPGLRELMDNRKIIKEINDLPHAIDYSGYCQIRGQLVVMAFLIHDTQCIYVTSIKYKKLTHTGLIISDLSSIVVLFYSYTVLV